MSSESQVVCSFRRTLEIERSSRTMLPWQATAEQEPEPRNSEEAAISTGRLPRGAAVSSPRHAMTTRKPATATGLQRAKLIAAPRESIKDAWLDRPDPCEYTARAEKSPGITGLTTFFVI
jgi:hypothetical protein